MKTLRPVKDSKTSTRSDPLYVKKLRGESRDSYVVKISELDNARRP
jgi:hypothetical protein